MSPSPFRQPRAAEPGGNRVLRWRRHIVALLPGRARTRRCLASQCIPGAAAAGSAALSCSEPSRTRPRSVQGSGTDPSAGSLGTARWSCSDQKPRSITAAFACSSAEQTTRGKPLVPHGPRDPRGDSGLSTNQGPNPNGGQVGKVGRSRGSRPCDRTNEERENKAASKVFEKRHAAASLQISLSRGQQERRRRRRAFSGSVLKSLGERALLPTAVK